MALSQHSVRRVAGSSRPLPRPNGPAPTAPKPHPCLTACRVRTDTQP